MIQSRAEILLVPFPGETLSIPYLGYEPVSILIERVKNPLGDKYLIENEGAYLMVLAFETPKGQSIMHGRYHHVIDMWR